MTTNTKKVLMITNLHWNASIQVGDHELARQFMAAGWKVGFISDPVTPLHLLQGFELSSRLRNYISGGKWENHGNLWWYVPGSLVMPYNVSFLKKSWVHDYWHKVTLPNLVSMVKRSGFDKVDLLYFRTAKQLFWLDSIDHKISIFRLADNDSGFFDYNEEVKKREQTLIRKADLTVYTSMRLNRYLADAGSKETLYLPNGVDFSLFSSQSEKPPEYKALTGKIAVHVGSVLPERFDFSLVDILTKHLPEVQFVFIGPYSELHNKFHDRPNVHLLGPRPLDQIPGYMQHADVGLILLDPIKNPTLVNSTNPLKLYQYLASGLQVVSKKWDTLIDLSPPIFMANNNDEFCAYLKTALSNSQFKKADLRRYAKKFDWKNQFNLLLDKIESVSRIKTGYSSNHP